MRNFVCLVGALLIGSESIAAGTPPPDFTQSILPIFEGSCVECHGAKKQKGKLRLDIKEGALRKEDIIVPGDADSSELYLRITLPEDDPDRMPNEGAPLTKAQTDAIGEWIRRGAVWPDGVVLHAKIHDASESFGLPEVPVESTTEIQAVHKLAAAGIHVLPLATNVGWRSANLRPLGIQANDQLVEELGQITTLIQLDLAGTAVTDHGLEKLAKLENLSRLHLERTRISDSGLAALSSLTELTYLNLYGTAVTDAGLDHLRPLTKLRQLYLAGTKTTEAGRDKLKAALPHLRIVTDPGPIASVADASSAPNHEKTASDRVSAEESKE